MQIVNRKRMQRETGDRILRETTEAKTMLNWPSTVWRQEHIGTATGRQSRLGRFKRARVVWVAQILSRDEVERRKW